LQVGDSASLAYILIGAAVVVLLVAHMLCCVALNSRAGGRHGQEAPGGDPAGG
jgi:hypothetical protein